MRFGIVAAAVAMVVAAPSAAAKLLYTINLVGTGGNSTQNPNGTAVYPPFQGATASLVLDTSLVLLGATQATFNARGYDNTVYSVVFDANGFTFSATYGAFFDRFYYTNNFKVCYTSPQPLGIPISPVAIDQACSVGGFVHRGDRSTEFFNGNAISFNVQVVPDSTLLVAGAGGIVPEPATWAMMLVGFGMLAAVGRRRALAASRTSLALPISERLLHPCGPTDTVSQN